MNQCSMVDEAPWIQWVACDCAYTDDDDDAEDQEQYEAVSNREQTGPHVSNLWWVITDD